MNICFPNIAPKEFPNPGKDLHQTDNPQYVVLGGGCFWCLEGVYLQLQGILEVTSGYSGGTISSANYESVSSGQTDHVEVIQIKFDSKQITYGEILKIFFSIAHDPTQLNKQGNDTGKHYRSVIFYKGDEQELVARKYIEQLNKLKVYDSNILTTLEPLNEFFEAELYHQRYVENNPHNPYIFYTAVPKIEKIKSIVQLLK